jgi:hypothetical protein
MVCPQCIPLHTILGKCLRFIDFIFQMLKGTASPQNRPSSIPPALASAQNMERMSTLELILQKRSTELYVNRRSVPRKKLHEGKYPDCFSSPFRKVAPTIPVSLLPARGVIVTYQLLVQKMSSLLHELVRHL